MANCVFDNVSAPAVLKSTTGSGGRENFGTISILERNPRIDEHKYNRKNDKNQTGKNGKNTKEGGKEESQLEDKPKRKRFAYDLDDQALKDCS